MLRDTGHDQRAQRQQRQGAQTADEQEHGSSQSVRRAATMSLLPSPKLWLVFSTIG
jgi:hypothetical protein